MRICIINNIIAPYRVPVFNELAKIKGVDLEVLFLAKSEPWRRWKIDAGQIHFKYRVLKSFCMRTKQYPVFFTPSIIKELSTLKPEVVYCGSYENPTSWLALWHAGSVRYHLWAGSNQRSGRRSRPRY